MNMEKIRQLGYEVIGENNSDFIYISKPGSVYWQLKIEKGSISYWKQDDNFYYGFEPIDSSIDPNDTETIIALYLK